MPAKKSPRESTQKYHIKLYSDNKLFRKGSWLEKPNEEILEVVEKSFLKKRNVKVLDLGSGVGRNAIPIAKKIGKLGGQVVCVDYLDIAIDKLKEYAVEYGVGGQIKGFVSPVEDFKIKSNSYDYIIAHSVLTHTESKEKMVQTIKATLRGVKQGGIVYIYMITNPKEFDAKTGKEQDPEAEVEISSKEACNLLKNIFKNWTIQVLKKNPYEERFMKRGSEVIWRSNYLLFIAQNKIQKQN